MERYKKKKEYSSYRDSSGKACLFWVNVQKADRVNVVSNREGVIIWDVAVGQVMQGILGSAGDFCILFQELKKSH